METRLFLTLALHIFIYILYEWLNNILWYNFYLLQILHSTPSSIHLLISFTKYSSIEQYYHKFKFSFIFTYIQNTILKACSIHIDEKLCLKLVYVYNEWLSDWFYMSKINMRFKNIAEKYINDGSFINYGQLISWLVWQSFQQC